MAAFRYEAIDASGKRINGILEAESARAARVQLRDKGITLVDLSAARSAETQGGKGGRRGLPMTEMVMLTQQISTLLNAGLTLERALTAVVDQSENPRARQIVAGLRGRIMEGQSFAQALTDCGEVFPVIYRSLVHAGEQSGHLDTVMERLAEYLERRERMRKKVMLALAYPAVVTLVAFAVVTGLMTYVVPQVVAVFTDTHQSLPVLTRMLVALSRGMREWGLVAAALVALAGWLFARSLRMPGVRAAVHVRLLALPVLGRLLRAINTARMASTLSILVGSGVPLLAAMETARGLVTLVPMQEGLTEAMARVREGGGLARALAVCRQFPPVLIHLIGSGEASGTLAMMLDKAAHQQQEEVESRLATFTTLIEPLLILVMGGVVMTIVLAIMLPIIDMNQMVH
ncbi:type II secretion system inner membrane protein GspF [Paludibacterium paludis]|uniref:General secretion pathway protein F n=1 Tax=Paludibacterium paludis TaxID=1225769 RepID=A0A918NZJ4_9NEIS|nr:type II secretion system inner membrane protein GspF [Paludibacterium paludis]GGY08131.1 type II secretion system protein GspF [Paludibacterium paludis]